MKIAMKNKKLYQSNKQKIKKYLNLWFSLILMINLNFVIW